MTISEATRPGKGRPRSQESEDSILDATAYILARDGYAGLTTDKIAARAHASKGTIYRRWPTKEHLVLAAFDRLPMLIPPDTGTLLNDVLEIALQFVSFFDNTPLGGVLSALVAERIHNQALAAAIDPVIARRREPVKEVLRRGIERGLLAKETDLDLAEDLIMGPLLMRMFYVPGDLSRPALREMYATVLKGLGARV